jgi:uncharacterized membrane protein (UPF0127 family)
MRFASLVLMFLLVCCGCGRKADNGVVEPLNTRLVSLPDGTEIRAEVLINPTEMARGMMYRDPLPQGRGLLFVHQRPDYYRYWMSNVKAPLDIIFMDAGRQIVEISADTPPCTTKPADCLLYGGHHLAQYVLELRAGEASRLGLHTGQKLSF